MPKKARMTNKERRRAPRARSSLHLDLYDPKGRMITGEGRFVNLSEIGAMLQSAKPLRPRTKVRLQIHAAKHSSLHLRGRVVWARKKGKGFLYGLLFDA
jgi:hypothetical protein